MAVVHGDFTKEQLETERREVTLTSTGPTAAGRQEKKGKNRNPVSERSDSRDSEDTSDKKKRPAARNMAAFIQRGYTLSRLESTYIVWRKDRGESRLRETRTEGVALNDGRQTAYDL